jgi:hypothetical protein
MDSTHGGQEKEQEDLQRRVRKREREDWMT